MILASVKPTHRREPKNTRIGPATEVLFGDSAIDSSMGNCRIRRRPFASPRGPLNIFANCRIVLTSPARLSRVSLATSMRSNSRTVGSAFREYDSALQELPGMAFTTFPRADCEKSRCRSSFLKRTEQHVMDRGATRRSARSERHRGFAW